MEATIVQDKTKHYPVLLKEIISIISPQHGGTFIDCTFGQGGYTKKILNFKNTKVIAIDRDLDSKKKADEIIKKNKDRFIFKNKKFSQIENFKTKSENIRGVIFDLGYSNTQIKDLKKGLSFDFDGKLNMRMGLNNFSAQDVINRLELEELEKIFKFYGEEKEAKKIAKSIVNERQIKTIDTQSLVQIINRNKRRKNFKINKIGRAHV